MPTPIICDFCNSELAKWRYPCQDFVLGLEDAPPEQHLIPGDWFACDTCSDFIEADDYTSLDSRVIAYGLWASFMEVLPPGAWDAIEAAIIALHRAFRHYRIGPRLPFRRAGDRRNGHR